MHNYIIINKIILNVKNFILFYFIYIFNLLYYTMFYNNTYKNLKMRSLTDFIDLFFMFLIIYVSRFFYIIFFYIFNIIYIYKIIKIYVLKQFIFKFKQLYFFNFLINVLELHYNLKMKVHLLKIKKYNKYNCLNINSKYKFLRYFSFYNTLIIFNLIYLNFCILKFKFFLFKLYLWYFTYYINFMRFLKRIKNDQKYSIKYIIQKKKKFLFLKFSNLLNKIEDKIKIYQNYNIKMTLKYYYNIKKKFLISLFSKIKLNIKNFFLIIKDMYFTYIVNDSFYFIFTSKTKVTKGNTIIFYIFLFLKYLKSFFIWLFTKVVVNYNLFKSLKKFSKK